MGLGMTARHLIRSNELMTVLNIFGHSENYSFNVKLKTATANELLKRSSLSANEIVKSPVSPALLHFDFDNFE